ESDPAPSLAPSSSSSLAAVLPPSLDATSPSIPRLRPPLRERDTEITMILLTFQQIAVAKVGYK
ncbi:hypothetical protein BHE74_00049247, partial [Ensete ventricosum]